MSVYHEALQANRAYASSFGAASLPMRPRKNLAVLACMDARLTIEPMLGLATGDAHIIRNAGGIATDDALRSLIISRRLQGADTVFVINHTDCGMLALNENEFRERLQTETGADASTLALHSFSDLETNVRAQVRRIESDPFVGGDAAVHGFIFDVTTGRLKAVSTN